LKRHAYENSCAIALPCRGEVDREAGGFWNNDVLSNLEGALQTIIVDLEKTPSRRAERADLPLSGGGDRSDSP